MYPFPLRGQSSWEWIVEFSVIIFYTTSTLTFFYMVLLHGFLLQDVAYRPQEFYVKTRKCGRDAKADVVQICERQVHFLMRLSLE